MIKESPLILITTCDDTTSVKNVLAKWTRSREKKEQEGELLIFFLLSDEIVKLLVLNGTL